MSFRLTIALFNSGLIVLLRWHIRFHDVICGSVIDIFLLVAVDIISAKNCHIHFHLVCLKSLFLEYMTATLIDWCTLQ